MKFFKYFISIILILNIAVLATYKYCEYKVSELLIPSKSIYSEDITEVLWVLAGEKGDVVLESSSVFDYVVTIASGVIGSKNSFDFSNGSNLANLSAKASLVRTEYRGHYYSAVASIWISNNWTIEQTVATALDNANYRYNLKSFSEASQAFFNKSSDSLTRGQIISLITLWGGSSVFDPFCYSDRFILRARSISKRLKENWPEKYSDYYFVRPKMTRFVDDTCKS